MSVDVVTFGCRLNAWESEAARRHAEAAGFSDAVVVNTCAVTSEAVSQARQTIRKLHRAQPAMPIVVTGCAAHTETAAFAAMPEVARVLGNNEKLSGGAWREAREALAENRAGKTAVADIMQVREFAAPTVSGITGHSRAFVPVQNGCDHRCTFCIIPFGRGNSRSLPAASVVAHVRTLVENGYREAVLTGVDITSYGADLPDTPTLGLLAKQILREVPELARLRFSSIDSVEVDRDLLDAFATEARAMPHLHLSLQAGDDMILKRMKRRHSRAHAIAFCETVRRVRPDVVFGADIIAGFPTETDDMFARSLDLVDECRLTQLHVFPFSPRPGTPAARMPQVRGDVVQTRARLLRDKGTAALRAHLDREIGAQRRVLVERGNTGHTEHFTPVTLTREAAAGTLLDVTMTGHDGRRLKAA